MAVNNFALKNYNKHLIFTQILCVTHLNMTLCVDFKVKKKVD